MNPTRTILVSALCAVFFAATHQVAAQTGGGVIIINPGGGTPPQPPVTSGVGPISPFFLTDVNSNHLLSITGTAISLDTLMASDRERPLAVIDTVRTMASFPGLGAEYSLTGTPSGQTYDFPPILTGYFFDGTTDGTFNYAWNHQSGTAYRFDRQWQNPTELFSLGIADGRRLGITFDPSNNSLWLSGDYDGPASATIENRTLSGELISSFSTGHVNNWALALDPADGTLWEINGYGSGTTSLLLEQYTRTGTKIGSATVITPSRYAVFGGEFAFTGTVVPEPSSALLFIGGGALCFLRRRFPKAYAEPCAAANCSARHVSCYSGLDPSRPSVALSYARCLLLRSTFAATAPRSAVAELGVVRRYSAPFLERHFSEDFSIATPTPIR